MDRSFRQRYPRGSVLRYPHPTDSSDLDQIISQPSGGPEHQVSSGLWPPLENHSNDQLTFSYHINIAIKIMIEYIILMTIFYLGYRQ